jgi:hypothetical protein
MYAFYNCSLLTKVSVPEGFTTFGYGTFYYCSGITSVNIPAGVTEITSNLFDYCSALTTITIPDSVTSIGVMAFECCGLSNITIPKNVNNIGNLAFGGCSKLTNVTVLATAKTPKLDTNSFFQTNKSMIIYVPYDSLSAYKTADIWKNYTIATIP